MGRVRRASSVLEAGFQLLRLVVLGLLLLLWAVWLIPVQKLRAWRAKRAFSSKLRGLPEELRKDLVDEFSGRLSALSPISVVRAAFSSFSVGGGLSRRKRRHESLRSLDLS